MSDFERETLEAVRDTAALATAAHAGLVALMVTMRKSGNLDCGLYTSELKSILDKIDSTNLSKSKAGQLSVEALFNIAKD
ncbi:hypothetical protein ACTUVN_002688 [Pseudomonas caspiana]